ncbi:MAG: cytochrome c [Gemmatimonadales bacterium]|nr:MAG: cytochrome c [Gemmatimonadales bacterium]
MAGLRWNRLILTVSLVGLAACGGGEKAPPSSSNAAPAAAGSDLTPFQLENGIGPITESIALGPIDKEEAEEGQKVFEAKCSACHKLGERYVGPPLGGILDQITPAFAMNMMLNPQEMYSRHPVVKKLLGEYMTQMPNQGLTQEEAREVVEYLRTTPAPAPAQ